MTTLESETNLDSLPLEGEIPEWLSGTLLRNGPGKFEIGERPLRHWFDGLAMLHRFSFAAGRVSYANRFLRSDTWREAEAGRAPYSQFATEPHHSIFGRAAGVFRPKVTDNCNINVARLGDEYIAMTETPLPLAFGAETLDARGVAYTPPGIHATAHPHHDPERRELVAYATHFGARSAYRLYAQSGRSRGRQIAEFPVSEPSYMHSFALTPRYAILVAFPLVVNPLRLALSRRPFIENYRWKPELGTRILVFDRGDGSLRGEYEAKPRFAFHHVNAFERGSELFIDMAAYDDASVIDAYYLDRLRAEPPPEGAYARLLRYRVAGAGDRVIEEELSDALLELPRIDYDERNGRPYRYVYGAGTHIEGDDLDFLNQVTKVDIESGEARTWWEPGSYPGEPVFVPRPERGRAEDDGVLLSVVLDSRGAGSYLLVLDARDLEELGRAQIPHHIPFGFHGQYFS